MFLFNGKQDRKNNTALIAEDNAHLQFDTSTGDRVVTVNMPNELYFDLRSIVSQNSRHLRFFIDDCVDKNEEYADKNYGRREETTSFTFDIDQERYEIAKAIADNRDTSIEEAFLFMFQNYLNDYYRSKFSRTFELTYTLPKRLSEQLQKMCEIHNCDEGVIISDALQGAHVMSSDISRDEWLANKLEARDTVKKKCYLNNRQLRLLMAMADYNSHSCDEELYSILSEYIYSR